MATCWFHLTGRLGNLLFQYAHARAYCERKGFDLCLPPNVIEQIFDVPAAVRPRKGTPADHVMPHDSMFQTQDALIYTKEQVQQWLRIRPEHLAVMAPLLQNRKPVTLDWRRGTDFLGAGLVSLGEAAYLYAASRHGYDLTDCEWEIDTEPTRMPHFTGDVNAAGEGCTMVSLPAFYRLMTAKVHFRANSSFSYFAAVLGSAKVYAPIIRNVRGGVPNAMANFVEGNWPHFSANYPTDLNLETNTQTP